MLIKHNCQVKNTFFAGQIKKNVILYPCFPHEARPDKRKGAGFIIFF